MQITQQTTSIGSFSWTAAPRHTLPRRRCISALSCSFKEAPCSPTRGVAPRAGLVVSRHARKGACNRDVRVWAGYEPFPFDEQQYNRVEFAAEPYGPLVVGAPQTNLKCVLVFQMQDTPRPLTASSHVMEVFVSGDTGVGLYALLEKQRPERPMALDILWQILMRGKELSNKNWGLLRVAITELCGEIYHARMFFGDAETNTVMWDIDCRPSDATFLALKAGAPIYIKRSVWERCALPLRDSAAYEAVQVAREHRKARAAEAASVAAARLGGSPEEGLNPDDLLPVKLLKRELEVAVQEENYPEAVRLRDHPWMRLVADIELHKSIGYHVEAQRLYKALKEQIEAQESKDGEDYESRLIRQHKAAQQPANGSPGSSSGSAAAPADEIKSERKFE